MNQPKELEKLTSTNGNFSPEQYRFSLKNWKSKFAVTY